MYPERNTDLGSALFPVEKRRIFLLSTTTEQLSIQDLSGLGLQYSEIPQFVAIVDVERNHVFSIVSENYRLVTNQEAVELGEKCFCTVFSEKTAGGMSVYNIITFCHIDFMHEIRAVEPWQNDRWFPFLRVTNSYNRTKPLRFDLGFCREICANGIIFGERSISFSYLHLHDDVGRAIEFDIDFTELKELEKDFVEKLYNLKRFYVPEQAMLPLLCNVLNIKIDKNDFKRKQRLKQIIEFRDYVNSLTEKYFSEIGQNGYAALSVITEFSTRPKLFISSESMVDPLQKRTGDWISVFINKMQDPSFQIERYLEDQFKQADLIKQASYG